VLQPHQRLGDFEIVRPLGQGGMGQVYEAQQFNPPRRVALKVLAPWLAENADALERFWREAAVPAQLDHPGIVRIISTGKTEAGVAYYTMQLVRGISLAELVRRAGRAPLPPTVPQVQPPGDTRSRARDTPGPGPNGAADDAPIEDGPDPAVVTEYLQDRYRTVARIGAQAARALAHAHRQGFLHRDIKPPNLMIDQHGQLYLVDFGLTRALEPDASGTQAGVVRGTAWYMSPEQARGEPVDGRSDIYSLGVTLYELVTLGHGPFTCSRHNSTAVLAQVKAGQGLPPRVFAPDVPPALERVILRAMHYRRRKRYAAAAELATALDDLVKGTAPGLAPGAATGVRRLRLRSAALVGAAAAILVAVLAVAAASFKGWHRPREEAPAQPGAPPAAETLESFLNRERPWGVRLPLLREDGSPDRHRRVAGHGVFHGINGALVVTSPADGKPTLLALDCPKRVWFEFSIELRQHASDAQGAHQLGAFYGWHEPDPADPLARRYYFTVGLDERPVLNDIHGRLAIGVGRVEEGEQARGGFYEPLRPLAEGRGSLPLPKPAKPLDWHRLRIRVLHGKVTVAVEGGPAREFEVAWVKRSDPVLEGAVLDPRGAVGVWVTNGNGYFRNATILALPDSATD
jgi:hypothetical protein